MELIERLKEADQALIGGAKHHAAIKDAIEHLTRHKEAIELANAILQTARPLVLNMMRMEDAARATK